MTDILYKCVNGENIPLTAEETAGRLADEQRFNAALPRLQIIKQISDLEAQQTPRRMREAAPDDAGGSTDGRAWLLNINQQISVLREQMV